MEVFEQNIVTTPGASEPQGSAVVSGSGVYTGSQVAGSPRSSSNDREGAGVASQALATLSTTSAEAGSGDVIAKTWRSLKSCLRSNDSGIKLLMTKADILEKWSAKVRSPEVKMAIEEVLKVAVGVSKSREEVVRATNAMSAVMQGAQQYQGRHIPSCETVEASTQTVSIGVNPSKGICVGTQSPAWDPPASSHKPEQRAPVPPRKQRRRRAGGQSKQDVSSTDKQRRQPPPEKRHDRAHKQEEHQQQPQQQQPPQQQTWSEVARRRKPPKPSQHPRSATDQVALLRKRAPRSMAVTIDRPAEGGSLASVMKKISGSINLQSLGVKVLTTRKTRAGGILLEVEGNEKATLLAGKIREVVGVAARVRLPEPRTPVLLLGVPEWAEAEDVVAGVTQAGVTGVTSEGVTIRKNSGGRGEFVASLHLPLKDAITLAEKKAVTVEWTKCRVKLLVNSQPTCFRCQGKGHLAAECRNEAKPRRCHRCEKDDHLVKDCALQKQTQQQQQPQPPTLSCEAPADASRAV